RAARLGTDPPAHRRGAVQGHRRDIRHPALRHDDAEAINLQERLQPRPASEESRLKPLLQPLLLKSPSHARSISMNQPALSAIALACVAGLAFAAPVHAATPTANGADITLYRSDSAALYASSGDNNVDDGYAVVRELRALALKPGLQDITLGDLPDHLDAEALALGFPDGGAKVVSQ